MSMMTATMELHQLVLQSARADFGAFAHRAFFELEGQIMEDNWHIPVIANLGMRMARGEAKRSILTMPPRYLKSYMMTVAYPAWRLGRDPRAKVICCSYGGDLAEKFAGDTLRLMRSDWYRQTFPNTVINPSKASKADFETTAGGYRFASSVGGTLTGRGADLIVIDDPLKASEAYSDAAREACVAWFNNSVRTRFNNPMKGQLIVVAQRLHAEDLPGVLIETGGWEEVMIPATQWQDTCYDLGPELKQVLARAGRILQPERQNEEYLVQLRREMGEQDYEAQFNQRPLPPGGATFRMEWLKRYDERPSPAKIMAIVQSWDTAYEDNETNDYSVCTTWAICGDGFYLLDVWRDRPKFFELEKKVYELRQRWRAHIVIVERAGAGLSLVQNIRDRDRHLWIQHLKPEGSKQSRAEQQSPKFEQGKIWLPREAPWLATYEKELMAFPHVKHDDQVDSTVQLLTAHDTGKLMHAVRNHGNS